MKSNFPACLSFTLEQEDGFSNAPDDPGGNTNQGITLATFQSFTSNPNATPADLRAMTATTRDTIYATRYWLPIRGDDLPAGLDLMCFDEAVNAGPARSVTLLQRALGFTGADVDGVIGPDTLGCADTRDLPMLLTTLGAAQADYYRSLAGFPMFGDGWLARCARRLAAAQQLATRQVS